MTDTLATLASVLAWAQAHPGTVIEYLLALWAIVNVVWSQWPRPKSAKAERIWGVIHSLLQLVVTHSTAPGTFTLPWLVRLLVSAPDPLAQLPVLTVAPDPAGDSQHVVIRPRDPQSTKPE